MKNTIASDHPLSQDEQALLLSLCRLIVPADEGYRVPGADDELIFTDILQSVKTNLEAIRVSINCASELEIPVEQATPMLEGRVELAPLVSIVMQCYYRDDRVMESLGMEARAPFPKGYEVPEGDWSMLEAVQARGKIWREV